jgi:alkylated DNA repair dioxygenase AlkB
MNSLLHDAPVDLHANFLAATDTYALLNSSKGVGWHRGMISLYGRQIPVPREEVLFGDEGLQYKYRGATIVGEAWPDFLLELRHRIETLTSSRFHFAVGNRYVNGKDSIGWHSDNFPQIGIRPPIASLSLGSTRRFRLRHIETRQTVDYNLSSGSLLLMRPGCQQEWEHCVPKTARPVGERINWTFRPHVDGAVKSSGNRSSGQTNATLKTTDNPTAHGARR